VRLAYVLILGATSDIGWAVAEEYATRGYDLYLAARRSERLKEPAKVLAEKYGVNAVPMDFDVRDIYGHEDFVRLLDPAPEGVLCFVGTLGRGPAPPEDLEDLKEVVEVNFLGAAAFMEISARVLQEAGRGFIVGVSSVAGDRGRQSNYPYGSAKAGLTAYLSGLRQRLHPKGIQVLTVKPGFVRTRMTEGMNLPPLLTADPDEVARRIVRAQEAGKNVIYVRRIWRPIMALIRILPERVFKRLRL